MKRPCPVNHCINRVGGNGVMCNRCWDSLPEEIQYRVLRSYWDWRDARRGRHGTAESAAIEASLHGNHAIQVRNDAINAAAFARRRWPVPVNLFGPHYHPLPATDAVDVAQQEAA